MDRNAIIRVLKLATFGGLTETDVNLVLMNYCLEHGKPYYETALFVTIALSNAEFLRYCFNMALNYYERKFTIHKVWSKPSVNLLTKQEERKLLQIF